MADQPSNPSIENLLAHREWVRAVARRLVSDPSAADDLVQDSWLAALRRPPREASNPRGWLAQVVRRQALQKGRADSRRARRERVAARPEATLSDLAQRAETHAEVVGHVLALDEPFRSVVLLRFFEDLTPPEIASRMDVPLKTVHSRLARAFAKLRERLDDEHGSRAQWSLVLLPLAETGGWTTPAAAASLAAPTGVLVMNGSAKLGWTAALIVAGCLGVWKFGGASEAPTESLTVTGVEEGSMPLDSGERKQQEPLRAELPGGERIAAGEEVPDEETEVAATGTPVRGRVFDAAGQPIIGVRVVVDGVNEQLAATSGAGGEFTLTVDVEAMTVEGSFLGTPCLRIDDEDWVTVRRSCLSATNLDLEHLVVASRMRAVEGWIQDTSGNPIAEASVRMGTPNGLNEGDGLESFPMPLDMTRSLVQRATSDAAGRFMLDRLPSGKGLSLYVHSRGYVGRYVDLDSAGHPLILELERPEETGQPMLEGLVVDPGGQPVEGAVVQLASSRTQSKMGGLFRMPIPNLASETPLCAAKPGLQPALIPRFRDVIEGAGGEPGLVELVLGGPSLSIAGRVLDANGQPCEGWTVGIADATEISQYSVPADTAETLARGGKEDTTTDAAGGFEIGGLLDRPYAVYAYDGDSLLRAEAVFEAGDRSAVIRVQAGLMERLTGRVVSMDGEPMAGIGVRVSLPKFRSELGFSSIPGQEVITAEDGSFELREVPDAHVRLQVRGESILPNGMDLEGLDLGDLQIEVTRRCHFDLELSGDLANAKHVWLEDDLGKRKQINRFQAGGMSAFPFVPLSEGRSAVFSVAETASILVVATEEKELGRFPIQLIPGEVTQLRP